MKTVTDVTLTHGLAFVAVTGTTRFLHKNTQDALLAQGLVTHPEGGSIELTAAGSVRPVRSPLEQAHGEALALGYSVSKTAKQKPGQVWYDEPTGERVVTVISNGRTATLMVDDAVVAEKKFVAVAAPAAPAPAEDTDADWQAGYDAGFYGETVSDSVSEATAVGYTAGSEARAKLKRAKKKLPTRG